MKMAFNNGLLVFPADFADYRRFFGGFHYLT